MITVLDIDHCLTQAQNLLAQRCIKKSQAYLDMAIYRRPIEIRHLSQASCLLLRYAAHKESESDITPRNMRYLELALNYVERVEVKRPGTVMAHLLREKLSDFFCQHNVIIVDAAFVARTPVDENHLPRFITDPARPVTVTRAGVRTNRQEIKAKP